MKRSCILAMSLVMVFLFCDGCATRQIMPIPDLSKRDPNLVLLRVSRPSTFIAGGKAIPVSDNGVRVGDIGGGGQLMWQRPPGVVELATWNPIGNQIRESKDRMPRIYANVVRVTLEAGEEYEYEVSYSWNAPSTFVITPMSPAAHVAPFKTLSLADRCGPYPDNYRNIITQNLPRASAGWVFLGCRTVQWSLAAPTSVPKMSDVANLSHLSWLVISDVVGQGNGRIYKAKVYFMIYHGKVCRVSLKGIGMSKDGQSWEPVPLYDSRGLRILLPKL